MFILFCFVWSCLVSLFNSLLDQEICSDRTIATTENRRDRGDRQEEQGDEQDDPDEWDIVGPLVSRRFILQQNCLRDLQQQQHLILASSVATVAFQSLPPTAEADEEDREAQEGQASLISSSCECCDGLFLADDIDEDIDDYDDIIDEMPGPETLPRRRNSTYLALACANAVSQGSMTRKMREMFEAQSAAREPPALMPSPRRSDIAHGLRAQRSARRSSSMNPLFTISGEDSCAPSTIDEYEPVQRSSSSLGNYGYNSSFNSSFNINMMGNSSSSSHYGGYNSNSNGNHHPMELIRCDKCSSILSPSQSPTPPAEIGLVASSSSSSYNGNQATISKPQQQQQENDAAITASSSSAAAAVATSSSVAAFVAAFNRPAVAAAAAAAAAKLQQQAASGGGLNANGNSAHSTDNTATTNNNNHNSSSSSNDKDNRSADPVVECEAKKLANVPNNREVVEEELPKPDTVKNARCLFESSLIDGHHHQHHHIDTYATLRIQHVKSNPSSKILRSESTSCLHQQQHHHHTMTLGRSPAERAVRSVVRPLPLPQPKLCETLAGMDETLNGQSISAEDKAYVIAVGRMAALRWPSRKEHVVRSPSPPANRGHRNDFSSSVNVNANGHSSTSTSNKFGSLYRSNPSLYRSRSSRRSTDVESLVSEASDWSSDLESEASFASSSRGADCSQTQTMYPEKEPQLRYVPEDVMQKIRSVGMSLVFVDGVMIDTETGKGETIRPNKNPDYRVKSGLSAGQLGAAMSSSSSSNNNNKASSKPAVINNNSSSSSSSSSKFNKVNAGKKESLKKCVSAGIAETVRHFGQTDMRISNSKSNSNKNSGSTRSPRIIACLPKQPTETKTRHSSGESSTSSGVSSGRSEPDTSSDAQSTTSNGDNNSSSSASPFSTLKMKLTSTKDLEDAPRSPSPGPVRHSGVKSLASSPFGLYSVVYNFNESREPMFV